jgi:hypothetical protein
MLWRRREGVDLFGAPVGVQPLHGGTKALDALYGGLLAAAVVAGSAATGGQAEPAAWPATGIASASQAGSCAPTVAAALVEPDRPQPSSRRDRKRHRVDDTSGDTGCRPSPALGEAAGSGGGSIGGAAAALPSTAAPVCAAAPSVPLAHTQVPVAPAACAVTRREAAGAGSGAEGPSRDDPGATPAPLSVWALAAPRAPGRVDYSARARYSTGGGSAGGDGGVTAHGAPAVLVRDDVGAAPGPSGHPPGPWATGTWARLSEPAHRDPAASAPSPPGQGSALASGRGLGPGPAPGGLGPHRGPPPGLGAPPPPHFLRLPGRPLAPYAAALAPPPLYPGAPTPSTHVAVRPGPGEDAGPGLSKKALKAQAYWARQTREEAQAAGMAADRERARVERAATRPPCTYFQQGRCTKGAACPFRHDPGSAPAGGAGGPGEGVPGGPVGWGGGGGGSSGGVIDGSGGGGGGVGEGGAGRARREGFARQNDICRYLLAGGCGKGASWVAGRDVWGWGGCCTGCDAPGGLEQ